MNRILRCFNVLLLSAATGFASFGKTVDENTAKTVGCNLLMSKGVSGVSTPADLTTAYVATAQGSFGVVIDYYVFNVKSGFGFVMVSGDDNIIPILAYSDESSFDINNMSPSTKDWIEGYQNQVTAAVTNNIPAQEGTTASWKQLLAPDAHLASAAKKTTVSPLMGTKWDQIPSYNNSCPVSGSSGTPTGCVATSTAQVMKFWNWPTVGCGYHSYTAPTYGVKFADFGNTAYNWTGMNLTSSTASTALLMFHIGVAVNMHYTTSASGSGAYTLIAESPITNCSEYALKTYFHYKRSLHGVSRYTASSSGASVTSTTAWGKILSDELDAGRPILYSGQGTSGGHAWVCDGYNSPTMFHMNWGWSGASDGYYTVDNLAPPALGAGGGGGNFNFYQSVIIGIKPDTFATATDNIKLAAHLDCVTDIPATYPIGVFAIKTSIINSGTGSFSGDFCAQVFDTSLNYVGTMQTITGQTIAAAATLPLTFSTTAPMLQMIPGTYRIRVLYRTSSTAKWTPVGDNGTFINENDLTINNSQSVELSTSLTLTPAITASYTCVKTGQPLTVAAKVVNVSSLGNFNGSLRAVFTNVATSIQTVVQTLPGQILFAGTPTMESFSTTSVPTSLTPGVYTIAIQHATGSTTSYTYTGSDYFENPIIVNVCGGLEVETPSVADKINVFPNPSNDVINISMNGVNASKITITDIRGRMIQEVTPDAVQNVMTVPVANYSNGIYFVNIFAGSEIVTKKIVVAK